MSESYSPDKILELENKIRSIPHRIIEAQEFERHRISKEIHDDLGQSLATLKMLIQSSVLPEYLGPPTNRKAYDRVLAYLDEIIDKTRGIATSLRPKVLETMGLTRAIKKLVFDFRKKQGLTIRAQIGDLDDLGFHGETVHLYRIIQEALANLLHHAEATEVEIICRRGRQQLAVTIVDNGKGFQPEEIGADREGFSGHGLSTMQERARLLGGTCMIESAPTRGTTIRLVVPVDVSGEAA